VDNSKINPNRKPYAKPVVQEVKLRINEAVLGTGCKMSSAGPALGITQNCAFPIQACLGNDNIGS
jgi:hypothetical protein